MGIFYIFVLIERRSGVTKSELRHKLSPSEAVEDYLKTIYLLREEAQARGEPGRVTTNALAERLGVEPGSVTGMLKKLAREKASTTKLVRHMPYHGVELTEVGEKLALEIVRHHRPAGTVSDAGAGLSLG